MVNLKYLFEPVKVGKLKINNRLVMCPMGTNLANEENMPTERSVEYYAARARGGVGLIIAEHSPVQARGRWSTRSAGIWDDKFIPGWKQVVDAVHSHGTGIALQIGHQGCSVTSKIAGQQTFSASPLPDHMVKEVPREMTTAEICELVGDYAAAAKRAVRAGFDAVEIHGTHGYLLASFMSGRTNRRTDEYGGSLEGRLRLPLEVIRAVRQAVGAEFPLLMRIASVEPNAGRMLEETKVLAKALVQEGLDALDVSAGSFADIDWEIPTYLFSPGFNLANIESIKRSVNVPVIACGRITEPRLAELVIAEGRADLVGLGRALIADPDWAKKARSGHLDDIRRCIGCARCVDEHRLLEGGGPTRCTVNPYVGREGQIQITRATRKKKVLVVGGGPAGLNAAAISAARGHDVTLWEKEDKLGGQVRIAAMPPMKHETASIISWTRRESEKNGVKLETGKTATVESILAFRPDAVVIATGSSPCKLDVPGINRSNVVLANDVLLGNTTVGERVLILGGGLAGCEVAHFLIGYGKEVTIVVRRNEIGQGLTSIVKPAILRAFEEHKVNIIFSASVQEILEDGVRLSKNGQSQVISGYSHIVLAVGSKPENELYQSIKDKNIEAYCIGDARETGKILEALNSGLEAGLKI